MIVGDLLTLEDLRLGLAWGTPELLGRRVTGVTSTDLQDPARYLQPGELVLSGLVWWQPDAEDETGRTDAAMRFATSLHSAGVAALLGGEGTHGSVPASLVDACRTHRIPLLTVPAGTSFRAVTDRIYLRLWGDLRKSSPQAAALPETVRRELATMLGAGAPLAEVLTLAVARLGLPECSVLSASGRTIAASGNGEGVGEGVGESTGHGDGGGDGAADRPPHRPLPPQAIRLGPAGGSPFHARYLVPGTHPMMPGLAELLVPVVASARSTAAERRNAAARLLALLGAAREADRSDLADAIGSCGLPPGVPLTAVTARIDRAPTAWALDALTEALHSIDAVFAAGPDQHGEATALVLGPVDRLGTLPPVLQRQLTASQRLRLGIGPAVGQTTPALRAALVRARYALAAADPVGHADDLDSLAELLRGVPAEVAAAFRQRILDPLTRHDQENGVSLLDTLSVFLDCDCSWARTARALHIHVNTVHYRIRRIETLTGRDLSRLADQCDLRTALLCRPLPDC